MNKVNAVLRVAEAPALGAALGNLYNAASEAVCTDALLKKAFSELAALTSQATTTLNSEKVTSKLEELDAECDTCVRTLGTVLTGYAALPIAAKQTAAQALLAVFNRYGKSITTANYATETTLIASLLEDLSAEDLQSHIEALDGVAEAISALQAAATAFKTANTEYNKATSAAKAKETASELKKSMLTCINDKIIPYLSAVSLIDAETYAEFASEIENEVNRANASTAKHSKKTTSA